MKLTPFCPICHKKNSLEKSHYKIGSTRFITLECGHTYTEKLVAKETASDLITLKDGRVLYPFQVDGVRLAESSNFRCQISDEMGLGKMQSVYCKVLTPKGWALIGSLKLNDEVIGSDGLAHKVIGVFPQGIKELFKVTFSDNSSTIVGEEHLWAVNTPIRKYRKNPNLVKTTKSLENDLFLTGKNSAGKKNSKWYIPIIHSPVEMDFREIKIDPYILGLFLGDGCFTIKNRISISTADAEIYSSINLKYELRKYNNYDYQVCSPNNLINYLKGYSLFGCYSHEKFIPDDFKYNTSSNRLAILQGLMDTDGSIASNGTIEFCSTSERLVNDVIFLVQSFGGVAYKSSRVTNYTYKDEKKDGKISYRITINIPVNPFRIFRKAYLYKPNKKYTATRAITSIEKVTSGEAVCISVDSYDKLYLTDDCILTHNTIQAIAAIDLHYEELKPILILVKSSLTVNWLRELVLSTGRIAQIFNSGDNLIPGIDIVIVSFDTVTPRKMRSTSIEDDSNLKKLIAFQPKTIIIDECQMLKNHNAKRTQAVREIARAKIIKRNESPTLIKNERSHIEKIAKDLIHYHSLTNKFNFTISDKLPAKILGLTKCRVEGEGFIKGEILINRIHIENDPEEEVIETILHEIAHAITPGTGHCALWSETAKSIGSNGQQYAWCDGTKPLDTFEDKENMVRHIISLSGTPIKNNALEYFPILNLLRPEMFPSIKHFESFYVDHYWNGNSYKVGGLLEPEQFLEKTKDFIIRRTREEVMPDLPKIQRDFKFYPMGDKVRAEYGKKVKKLGEFLRDNDTSSKTFNTDLIAQLSILRHITGLAKIQPVLDYISDFLEVEESEKIVIFHHHKDVGTVLSEKLHEMTGNQVGILRIVSEYDANKRTEILEAFKNNPANRILLIPTLAGGEGINLQFCSHAIIMEREWNPCNESQAEGRFSRIGSISSSVSVTYPTAIGTIDEYFAEIVERKRQFIGESLDGKAEKWDNSSVMLELANLIIKKWSF